MNERTIFLCDSTKCKLYLEKPITLPCCGHTICQKHIQIGENRKYKCEFCSKQIHQPDGGFHINLKLSYLIELNRSQKVRPSTSSNMVTNKQRSFSVGRPITNSNLSLYNNKNNSETKSSIINLNNNHHQATKRKSSLSSSLPLSAQSTPPNSPSSPSTPSGLLPKNIKSRIPLPINPPKRKQILSENGAINKYDLNDSGLISTPATMRHQKENINSSDQFILPYSRRSKTFLKSSSPILNSSSTLNSVIRNKKDDEQVILDAHTYRSLIQDLNDTKNILYKLEEMLLQDVNSSLNESGLNDSPVIHELNKSDFVFEI